MQAIVMYSGGVGSWAAGMRAVQRYGQDHTTLLFCDTNMEDADLYRFLSEGAEVIGVPVTRITDGRTPWEVFHDERYLGNTHADPCSKILKRELADSWIAERYTPDACIRLVGMDACQREQSRLVKLQQRCAPYVVDAPLLWDPPLDKEMAKALVLRQGLRLPRLYEMGFPHNNCGGFCVKAGLAQFALLHRVLPQRYLYHQRQEEAMRIYLGKNVSILRDRRHGRSKPLTMAAFAAQLDQQLPMFDEVSDESWESCNCFA
jgi:hypothetical protein